MHLWMLAGKSTKTCIHVTVQGIPTRTPANWAVSRNHKQLMGATRSIPSSLFYISDLFHDLDHVFFVGLFRLTIV